MTSAENTSRAAEIARLLNRLAELFGTTDAEPPEERQKSVPTTPERVLLTVEEAAERLGVGRTTAFALVKSGQIESVLIGRLRRVPTSAVRDYAARLVAIEDAQRKAA
jgi:excisionase family DNA binding protein